MTVRPYPEYKDSGIEWIGAIPASWERVPFFAATRERCQKNVGMKEDNLLSLSYGNVVRKDMSSNDGLLPESFETYQVIRPSDVVFRLTDLQNDKRSLRSAIVTERGIITSAYLAVSPIRHIPAYLAYLMRSYDLQKVFYSMGGGLRQSIKFEDMKHLPLVFPSLGEQRQIADYLDAHTAKIDALIGKQERLIEALAERRQAVISHAVTNGLDPNAPMKDSGVEWLGDIPREWEVKRLKHVGKTQIGLTYDPADIVDEGEGVLVLRSGNVQGGQVSLDDNVYVRTHIPRSLFTQVGDILICARNGSRSLIGKNARINEDLAGATFGAFMSVLRSEIGDYLSWVLNSLIFRHQMGSFVTATINQLTNATLNNFEVPVPPRNRQLEIVQYLDRETSQIDALSAKAREMIDVLKERRQALISAAVTGKIDVRGLA